MNKVVHFEIPVDDVKRAQDFYSKIFGWKINPIPGMDYTVVFTGPTDENRMLKETGFINGGMMKRSFGIKNLVITIDVEDIDKAIKKVVAGGGKMIRGKTDIGGDVGYSAYIEDPEGNIIGLWQSKTKKT